MKFPVIVKRLLENKIVSVTKSLTVKNNEKQDVKIHEPPSEESDNAQGNLSNFEEFVLDGLMMRNIIKIQHILQTNNKTNNKKRKKIPLLIMMF